MIKLQDELYSLFQPGLRSNSAEYYHFCTDRIAFYKKDKLKKTIYYNDITEYYYDKYQQSQDPTTGNDFWRFGSIEICYLQNGKEKYERITVLPEDQEQYESIVQKHLMKVLNSNAIQALKTRDDFLLNHNDALKQIICGQLIALFYLDKISFYKYILKECNSLGKPFAYRGEIVEICEIDTKEITDVFYRRNYIWGDHTKNTLDIIVSKNERSKNVSIEFEGVDTTLEDIVTAIKESISANKAIESVDKFDIGDDAVKKYRIISSQLMEEFECSVTTAYAALGLCSFDEKKARDMIETNGDKWIENYYRSLKSWQRDVLNLFPKPHDFNQKRMEDKNRYYYLEYLKAEWREFYAKHPGIRETEEIYYQMTENNSVHFEKWIAYDDLKVYISDNTPAQIKAIKDHIPQYGEESKEFYRIIADKPKLHIAEIDKRKINYYKEKGDLNSVSTISGGGVNMQGAILGGLLFGGAGAIVGSSVGTNVNTKVETADNRCIELNYTDQNGKIKIEILPYACLEVLNNIIPEKVFDYVSTHSETSETTTKSITEEIREYKKLLDEGIITEEEFASMKNKLINS